MNKIKLSSVYGFVLLMLICLMGCQKEPIPSLPDTADLAVVLQVRPGACKVVYKVTKGGEPNIYRDGELVSQGDYHSSKEQISGYQITTFQHHGSKLKVTVYIIPYFHYTTAYPSIQAIVYRNGKVVSEFSQTYEVRPRKGNPVVDFEVHAR